MVLLSEWVKERGVGGEGCVGGRGREGGVMLKHHNKFGRIAFHITRDTFIN